MRAFASIAAVMLASALALVLANAAPADHDGAVVPEGAQKTSVGAYSLAGGGRAHTDAVRVAQRYFPPNAEDSDGDGFDDGVDNRSGMHNPGQLDTDGDRVGDFADPDKDGDGTVNHLDPDPKDTDAPGNSVGRLPPRCDVVIDESDDLDAAINNDPSTTATKFCVTAGTHRVSDTAILRGGDSISGPLGAQTTRGPAVYGQPTAKLVGDTTDKVISASGPNVTIEWVDVSGGDGRIDPDARASNCPSSNLPEGAGCPVVGTGVGIALGQGDGTTLVRNVRVHDNDGVGISNAMGRIENSEFFSNTLDDRFLGVVGSAIKGVAEFEAARNYVHDEQGVGIWHDHSLSGEGDEPAMASNPGGGTWVHHNLVVDNDRYGIRFEYSPRNAAEGQHLGTPTFLAEANRVAGTRINAGASHADAQNGAWESNIFGQQTVAGVSYGGNFNGRALVIGDSGRSDRTDLWNADVHGNKLNGESISGCRQPDEVVSCSGNG
jgi:hypothetical protein